MNFAPTPSFRLASNLRDMCKLAYRRAPDHNDVLHEAAARLDSHDALTAANAALVAALWIARGHINMTELRVSHCKDAAAIAAALKAAKGEA